MIDIVSVFNLAINDTNSFNFQYQTVLNDVTSSCWTGGYTKKQLLSQQSNLMATFNGTSYQLPSNTDILEANRVGGSGATCDNPEEYLFWEHVHPTYQIHKALFNYVVQQISSTSSAG